MTASRKVRRSPTGPLRKQATPSHAPRILRCPIWRQRTGGLRDTVDGYDGQEVKNADGIGFNDYNETGLDYGFALSKKLSANPANYFKAAQNAMALDRSWKKSANAYEKLYNALVKKA